MIAQGRPSDNGVHYRIGSLENSVLQPVETVNVHYRIGSLEMFYVDYLVV